MVASVVSSLVVNELYTRANVYEILDVPLARRGGNWATGYTRFGDSYYLFSTVGVPGRTGHDYSNYWEDDQQRFVWEAKAHTRLGQPEISAIVSGNIPVHIFTREHDRQPFTYRGLATPETVRDTCPVGVTWTFGPLHQPPDIVAGAVDLSAAVDPVTETEYLRAQRLGQAKFRSDLLRRWQGSCALTSIAMPEILRASHIKAWRDSSNAERVNPDNGLLLAVHIDGLFDRGFLSFRESGATIVSPIITPATLSALAIGQNTRIVGLSQANQHFLAQHRARHASRLGL